MPSIFARAIISFCAVRVPSPSRNFKFRWTWPQPRLKQSVFDGVHALTSEPPLGGEINVEGLNNTVFEDPVATAMPLVPG